MQELDGREWAFIENLMKRLLTIISLIFFCTCLKAQTVNEKLYNAVSKKDTIQVEKLLSNGADANYRKKIEEFESSLLIQAILNGDFKTVKLLIDYKVQVNWKDWFSTTPLMYAASKGDLNIVKYLLKSGADIHANDGQGNTVLSAAKEGNHPEVVKFIEDSLNKQ